MAIRRPPGRAVNRGPGKEKNRAATLWWLADGVAAAIFAGGIALAVAMADGMRILGLVLMLVAGALRAAERDLAFLAFGAERFRVGEIPPCCVEHSFTERPFQTTAIRDRRSR